MKTISQSWDMDSLYDGGAESKAFSEFINTLEKDINHAIMVAKTITIQQSKDEMIHFIKEIGFISAKATEAKAFSTCLTRQNISDEVAKVLSKRCDKIMDSLHSLFVEFDQILLKTPESMFEDEEEYYFLKERKKQAESRLSPVSEELIQTLGVNGIKSWSGLRQKVIAGIKLPITMDGEHKIISGRNALHLMFTSHSDPLVRKSIHEHLEEAVEPNKELLAMGLNQIVEINKKISKIRGYKNQLVDSLRINRLSDKTLKAMNKALEKNLPRLTPYFKRKAELLGMTVFGERDVLASIGENKAKFSYEEAVESILKIFGNFSPLMEKFAYQALHNRWIDVENRENKSFIESILYMPISKQSRIMTRYHGDFVSVSTLAHELGHAYHHDELSKKELLAQTFPLSMAEIPSTFAEMLVTNGHLESMKTKEEKLIMLDEKIKNTLMYTIKPYVYFLFQQQLYMESKDHHLSASELDELMINVQKFVYQGALDSYTPIQWITNNLFYLEDRPYYNYQYTFGYLFSAGLLARVKNGSFTVERYSSLLQDTGSMCLEDLALKHLGVDLNHQEFWQDSIDLLFGDIDHFLKLQK